MISKRTITVLGILLIVAALLVTGSSYKSEGTLDSAVAVAAGICVLIGLALIIGSGYMKKN